MISYVGVDYFVFLRPMINGAGACVDNAPYNRTHVKLAHVCSFVGAGIFGLLHLFKPDFFGIRALMGAMTVYSNL